MSAIRLSDGKQAQGEIITVDERHEDCDSCPGRTAINFEAIYEFRLPDGRHVTGTANYKSEPGDKVIVVYNPDDPKESRIAGDGDTTVRGGIANFILMLVFGGAIGAYGVGLICKGVREFKTGEIET